MGKLIQDPALGTQSAKFDFKRETNLATFMGKVFETFKVAKEEQPKFVLQIKATRQFVSRAEELWSLSEDDLVILRSVKLESSITIKDLSDIVVTLSDPTVPVSSEQQSTSFAAYLNTLYRNFKQSDEYTEECVRGLSLDRLLEIALIGSSTSTQLYAIEAYSYALACGMAGIEFVKGNMESTAKMYELLGREGLASVVLETLVAIIDAVPASHSYIMKAAKRTAVLQGRAPFSELVDLLRSDDLDAKMHVMQLMNNMIRHAPTDKILCKFVAQIESLNFYEYLQEASTLRSTELNQLISNFQALAKVTVKTTQFENEALRNRVKELTQNCDRLEEKLLRYAQQQNLFELMKDDFRSFGAMAKMSIERGTLYVPFLPTNHYGGEMLKSLPEIKRDVVDLKKVMDSGFSVSKKWQDTIEQVKKERNGFEEKFKNLEKEHGEAQKLLSEMQEKCEKLEKERELSLKEANKKFSMAIAELNTVAQESTELKTRLKETMSKAEQSNAVLKKQTEEAEMMLRKQAQELADLLKKKNDESDTTVRKQMEDMQAALRRQVEDLEREREELKRKVRDAETKVRSPQEEALSQQQSSSLPQPPAFTGSLPMPPNMGNLPLPPFGNLPKPPSFAGSLPLSPNMGTLPLPPAANLPKPPAFSGPLPMPPNMGSLPVPPAVNLPRPPTFAGPLPLPPNIGGNLPVPPQLGNLPRPPVFGGPLPMPPNMMGTLPLPPQANLPRPPSFPGLPMPPAMPGLPMPPRANLPLPPGMTLPTPPNMAGLPMPPGGNLPRPPTMPGLPTPPGGMLPRPPTGLPMPPTGLPMPPSGLPQAPMMMPRPMPMMMMGGIQPTKPKITLTKKLKNISWTRYIIAPQGNPTYKPSIWDSIEDVKIDQTVVESLFCDAAAKPTAPTEAAVAKPTGPVIKKVFSADRSKKVAIIISRLPPAIKFRELLLKLDTTEMDKDKVAGFLSVWLPPDEKSILLDEMKAEPDARWDKQEDYIIHLIDIAQIENRLRIWKFMLGYEEDRSFAARFNADLTKGFDCVVSKTMKTILGIVLALGNILNGGSNRGQADGFNIDVISRLNNVSDVNKKSALCFVANKLKELNPEANIAKEFEPVEKARRMNIVDLESKVKALVDGFNDVKAKKESVSKAIKDPKADPFEEACGKFIAQTETDVNNVQESFDKLKAQYKSVCELFRIGSEDGKSKSTEEFFSFFGTFYEQLHKAFPIEKKPSRAAEVSKRQVAAKAKPAAPGAGAAPAKKGGVSDALSRLRMARAKDDK